MEACIWLTSQWQREAEYWQAKEASESQICYSGIRLVGHANDAGTCKAIRLPKVKEIIKLSQNIK